MRKCIHYEAAFVHYLQTWAVPYVPVDEARRVAIAGARIKSFDLMVYAPGGCRWIVDVKGRQFPYIAEDGARRYWENWVTREDIEGLQQWESVFGDGFEARFVFAYLLEGPPDRWPAVPPHAFRGEQYAFLAVPLAEYALSCRQRSPSWNTVSLPAARFREIARPIAMNGRPPG